MSQIMTETLRSGKSSESKKVLITGATGLIGSYAVPQLLDAGFEVFAASRSGKGPAGVALDLHDVDVVSSFMNRSKPDYLLHLAWNVEPGFYSAPNNLDWVVSSLNLLKAFAENGGKRAVFAGTCCEYDMSCGFLQEDITPEKPASLYGTAKLSLYNLALGWSRKVNLSFACGRVFFLYGKVERNERIVPYIIDSLLKGEKPALKFPFIKRDYTYAGDIAEGLISLLQSDFNGAVNIASGSAVSLHSIAEKVAVLINCPVPEYQHDREKEDKEIPLIIADTRRLNSVINFQPRVSWEDGLREVINWRRNLLCL